jgi:hypothetical protein
MENANDHGHQLRVLAMRVAALEDNVAFLERWCEEQQDALDRTLGPIGYDYERETEPRQVLRVVDLRDTVDEGDEGDEHDAGDDGDTIVAVVATEYDRRVRAIQAKLHRLRRRIALSVAPPAEVPSPPPPPRSSGRRVSVKPASRTAP